MQKRNEEAFADIQDVNVIADDLIIAARNDNEHDAIIHRVLQRARIENAVFNVGKVQFKVTTVSDSDLHWQHRYQWWHATRPW